jgi:hypothetical protein
MKAMRVGKDSSAPGGAGGCEYENREVPDGSSGWIISGNNMITCFHIFGDLGKIGRDNLSGEECKQESFRKPAAPANRLGLYRFDSRGDDLF